MVRAVTPIPFVKARFFDRCGKPLAGGKVYTYEANTTTPKVTYKDPYGLTPNTNPIILDAAGEADIYLDGTYRIRITDRNDVLVNDVEKIGSWFSDNLQDTLDNISGAMDDALKPILQNLDNAINAAAAAGAGANGWTDVLIATESGKTQRQVNNENKQKVSTTRDFGDINKASQKILLSSIYSTLELAKKDYPFVTDLNGSLGWAMLQKQFYSLSQTQKEIVAVSGKFYVNKPLEFNGDYTKTVFWNAELLLDNGTANDWAITFNANAATHVGNLSLNCFVTDTYDNYDWTKRSWFHGINCNRVIGGDFSGLSVTGRLKGQLFKVDGVGHNANYFKIGALSGACGSINDAFVRNITALNNTNTATTGEQRTVITVDKAIDFDISKSIVKIGSDYHIVTSNSSNTITVYPIVVSNSSSVSIYYGGILQTTGDNANGIIVKQLRAYQSACALSLDTAYGIKFESFGAEFCAVGVQYGLSPTSTIGALTFDLWYSEVNALDIIDVTADIKLNPITILAQTGLVGGTHTSKLSKLTPIDSDLVTKILGRNINLHLPFGFMQNQTEIATNKQTGLNQSNQVYHYFGTQKVVRVANDTVAITLAVDEKIKNMGVFECEIVHTGTKHNGGVEFTTITCEAPYTIFNADEVSQRSKYYPATAHPRRLIARLRGTVFYIYDLSEQSYNAYHDLAKDFGTGVVNINQTTQNTGGGLASTQCTVASFKTNSDVYTPVNVDIAYSITSDRRALVQTRSRVGGNAGSWTALLNCITFFNVDELQSNATNADVINKLNQIIRLLKSNS